MPLTMPGCWACPLISHRRSAPGGARTRPGAPVVVVGDAHSPTCQARAPPARPRPPRCPSLCEERAAARPSQQRASGHPGSRWRECGGCSVADIAQGCANPGWMAMGGQTVELPSAEPPSTGNRCHAGGSVPGHRVCCCCVHGRPGKCVHGRDEWAGAASADDQRLRTHPAMCAAPSPPPPCCPRAAWPLLPACVRGLVSCSHTPHCQEQGGAEAGRGVKPQSCTSPS